MIQIDEDARWGERKGQECLGFNRSSWSRMLQFLHQARIEDRKATEQTDSLWNATGNSGRGAEP
jgi:hypothetical protein